MAKVEFLVEIKTMLQSNQHKELPPKECCMSPVLATLVGINYNVAFKELANIFMLAFATLSSTPWRSSSFPLHYF
jgi:hypothetical protein